MRHTDRIIIATALVLCVIALKVQNNAIEDLKRLTNEQTKTIAAIIHTTERNNDYAESLNLSLGNAYKEISNLNACVVGLQSCVKTDAITFNKLNDNVQTLAACVVDLQKAVKPMVEVMNAIDAVKALDPDYGGRR